MHCKRKNLFHINYLHLIIILKILKIMYFYQMLEENKKTSCHIKKEKKILSFRIINVNYFFYELSISLFPLIFIYPFLFFSMILIAKIARSIDLIRNTNKKS